MPEEVRTVTYHGDKPLPDPIFDQLGEVYHPVPSEKKSVFARLAPAKDRVEDPEKKPTVNKSTADPGKKSVFSRLSPVENKLPAGTSEKKIGVRPRSTDPSLGRKESGDNRRSSSRPERANFTRRDYRWRPWSSWKSTTWSGTERRDRDDRRRGPSGRCKDVEKEKPSKNRSEGRKGTSGRSLNNRAESKKSEEVLPEQSSQGSEPVQVEPLEQSSQGSEPVQQVLLEQPPQGSEPVQQAPLEQPLGSDDQIPPEESGEGDVILQSSSSDQIDEGFEKFIFELDQIICRKEEERRLKGSFEDGSFDTDLLELMETDPLV